MSGTLNPKIVLGFLISSEAWKVFTREHNAVLMILQKNSIIVL